jgi:hypothetical protein
MKFANDSLIKMTCTIVLATAVFGAGSSAMAQSLFNPTPAVPPVVMPAPAPAAAQPAVAAEEKKSLVKPAAKPAAKAAKKPAQASNASAVLVVNKRKVALIELVVTSTKTDDAKPQTIASDLAGGKRTSAALAKNGGCLYDISGLFSDESVVEVNGADLCKDSTISLVE